MVECIYLLSMKSSNTEKCITKMTSLQTRIQNKLISALHGIRGSKCGFLNRGIHGRNSSSEHRIPHHQTTRFGPGLRHRCKQDLTKTHVDGIRAFCDRNCSLSLKELLNSLAENGIIVGMRHIMHVLVAVLANMSKRALPCFPKV